jgi:hypothetical protein
MIDTKTEPKTSLEAAHELTVLLGHIEALVRECPTPTAMVDRMVEDGADLKELSEQSYTEDFVWSWVNSKMPHFAQSVVVDPTAIQVCVGVKVVGTWTIGNIFADLHEGIR